MEHYTGIFGTSVETIKEIDYVRELLLCCGVQDEIEGEDDIDFSAASLRINQKDAQTIQANKINT